MERDVEEVQKVHTETREPMTGRRALHLVASLIALEASVGYL
jgi:hypothetical protein